MKRRRQVHFRYRGRTNRTFTRRLRAWMKQADNPGAMTLLEFLNSVHGTPKWTLGRTF